MNKISLTFTVNQQELKNTTKNLRLASGTVDYVDATFELGDNWDSFDSVRAIWTKRTDAYSTVLDAYGYCKVPTELLADKGTIKVNLVGSITEEIEGEEVLTDRLTTFSTTALSVSQLVPLEGEETSPLTPSQFEQFVLIVQGYSEDAVEAKEGAEAAQALAETAQGLAEQARTGAEAAETNAQGYAEDASGSADSASLSATASQGFASDAQSYAGQASTYADNASASATSASGYATTASGYADDAHDEAILARSYARGDTSTRTGEATDNAKYYSEQSASSASDAETAKEEAEAIAESMVTNLVDGNATGSVRGVGTVEESSSYSMGQYAFAEGQGTTASGTASHSEGGGTTASGATSHAEGGGTEATAQNAHSEGGGTHALGIASHAEGNVSTARGVGAHSEGAQTIAEGDQSHAEGYVTTASGSNSHAEGMGTEASGGCSHAEGGGTVAKGNYSHTSGNGTQALSKSQFVCGEYNELDNDTPDARGDYAFIVGNGNPTGSVTRSNAFTVKWNGDVDASGEITDGTGNTLSDKVDSVSGKGLSTEDYTTAEKTKLSGIEDGAEVNPTIDTELSAESTNPVQNKAIAEAIEEVSEVLSTGYYPDLYAGGLVTDKGETDTAPYTFRASKALGYRESLNQIVGATVGWNQQINPTNYITGTYSGITVTRSGNELVANGAASANAYIKLLSGTCPTISGHKYAVLIPSNTNISYYDDTGTRQYTGKTSSFVFNANGSNINPYARINSGTSVSNARMFMMLIDLTAMFGTSIANKAYTLEQSTPGSGIAWLRSYGFLTKDYYEYCQPRLESVRVSGHETTEKNQFNGQTKNGKNIESDGSESTDASRSCTTAVGVFASTTYTISYSDAIDCGVFFYDASNTFISFLAWGSNPRTFTTPSNARYVRFSFKRGTAPTNIQLEFGSTATTYTEYTKHTYPLDSTLTLKGILKLSGDEITADGDVYPPSGGVGRRYGVVDLGTLTWRIGSTSGGGAPRMVGTLADAKGASVGSEIPNMLCVKYQTVSANQTYNRVTGVSDNIGGGVVVVFDSDYTDPAAFKSAMSGVYLVYELATPTTETADPYTQIQICDPDGTEQFVDYGVASGDRDVAIPVGHSTFYPEDLKGKLEDIPDIPEAPASNGTYVLKAVRSNTGVVYSWVSG